MNALPAYMSVLCVFLVPSDVRKRGHKTPKAGVTYGCELPCGCWNSNPGPLQKQLVLS